MKLRKLIKWLIPKPIKSFLRNLSGLPAFNHVSITNNELPGTIAKLKKQYRFYKPTLVSFLINFYEYLLKLESDLPIYTESEFLIIHCCCWSKSYAEKMKSYFLTSLLSPNNLPTIGKKLKTMILIHCDQLTKDEILNSPVGEELKKHAILNFITVPDTVLSTYQAKLNYLERRLSKKSNFIDTFKYILLGGLQTHAFKIALKNKAYISFMMPDVILSDSFFSEMFSAIGNKKVVVSTTFRTNYQNICEKTKKFYANPAETVLSIPACTLTELQIENIHQAAKRRVVSESTYNFSPCAQLIFEALNGFVIRTFHYHPILINCAQLDTDIKMDYFPIDNSVLNQMVSEHFPFDQQLSVCNDSTRIAWIELSDENIEENFATSQPAPYAELVKKIKDMIFKHPSLFDTPLNRYFFSIRNEVYSNKIPSKKVYIDDLQFASDLRK